MRIKGTPAFLVKETRVETEYDGAERTAIDWYPAADMAEVNTLIAASDRPGYGTDLVRIDYGVYAMTLTHETDVTVKPQTMADLAYRLVPCESSGCTRLGLKIKVDVKLGHARRTPTVFWSSGHSSYVIVRPGDVPTKAEKRLTSDQGVMLLSVNGVGEIRWDVDGRTGFHDPDQKEAVEYFKLTWAADPDRTITAPGVDACEGCGTVGARFPAAPDCAFDPGDGGVLVERCDACESFADDLEAAKFHFTTARLLKCPHGDHHAVGYGLKPKVAS